MISESTFNGTIQAKCKADSAKTSRGKGPPVSSAPAQTSSAPDGASAKFMERLVSQGRSQSNLRL